MPARAVSFRMLVPVVNLPVNWCRPPKVEHPAIAGNRRLPECLANGQRYRAARTCTPIVRRRIIRPARGSRADRSVSPVQRSRTAGDPCGDDLCQTLLMPPSTTMSEPVMNELSSEARNRAAAVAVRQGLGMATLPCFVGDADKSLVRVPGAALHRHGTLWLLSQGETRKTQRVRLFLEFVSRRLGAYGPLLAGRSACGD